MRLPDVLRRALSDWPTWPVAAKPEVVQSFHDGLNNQAWLISCAGQQWVLKLFAGCGLQAIEIQQWAAELRLAPQIVFAPADHSYCLMPYLDSKSGAGDTQAIATSLHKLHTQPWPSACTSNGFNLLGHCHHYLRQADRRAAALHGVMLPILHRFADDRTPPVYNHNDLVSENCLLDGERCVFIDWEFAGPNNPWWDLASVIVYQRLDPQQAARFIGQYDKELGRQSNQPVCLAAQCAVLWLDILWYLQREEKPGWGLVEDKRRRLRALAAELGVYL